MKVKELKEILKDVPDDYEVVMSRDGEGNGFSPLADFGLEMYVPDSTWSGEIFSDEDGRNVEFKENSIVLWPTN